METDDPSIQATAEIVEMLPPNTSSSLAKRKAAPATSLPKATTTGAKGKGKAPLKQTGDWQAPKNPAKKTKTGESQQAPTPLANQFDQLSEVREGAGPAKKTRIPPVVIKLGEKTHQTTMTFIKANVTSSFTMKYISGGRASVNTSTTADRESLLGALRRENLPFHTFSTEEEKMKRTVIRGLPTMDVSDIEEDLKGQGLKVSRVVRMTTRSQGSAMYIAYFPHDQEMDVVRDIRVICHCRVTTQKYRPKGSTGTQCFRCQSFGHAARHCNHAVRCVKCQEAHLTNDCPKKTREEPAACCNCGGAHPANYRQCPKRQNYVAAISRPAKPMNRNWSDVVRGPARTAPHPPTPRDQPTTSRTPTPAERIAAAQAPPPHTTPPVGDTSELMAIIRLVTGARSKLAACSSRMEKAFIILELLENLED
jgi:hypothetical protein